MIKDRPTNTKVIAKDIDWNVFLSYAMHHRLFPRVYKIIKELSLPFIPSFVQEQLALLYKRNTLQMLNLTREMSLISELLAENNTKSIFLKGPVVAQELYGDISSRTSSDLDFLIPISRLEKTEEILVQQGYIKIHGIETVLNDWRWRQRDITYYHPVKHVKLEIHWRLHPGPGKEQSFNELWQRKRKSTITNSPLYFLGNEDLFHYLVTHGARHGWARLRWLDDIQQLLIQDLDWDKIFHLFKSGHNIDVCGQVLILVNELLDVNLTTEMTKFTERSRPKVLAQKVIFYLERKMNFEPIPEDMLEYHTKYLFSIKSTYQKMYFFLSLIYPHTLDAKTLPLPKQIHFLYFPLRPFLWAWRKMKKPVLP